MRRKVEGLAALPGKLDRLAGVVTDLANEVAAKARRPEVVHGPSWMDIAGDVRTTTKVLRDLLAWMNEVYLRYADAVRVLPDCWLWHPDVVEELVWLMHAWHAAYRVDEAPVSLAGDWHDRYRPGVVQRIKTLAGTCSLESHRPGGSRFESRPVVPLGEAMGSIAQWWALHRQDPAPAPTEQQLAAHDALPRRRSRS